MISLAVTADGSRLASLGAGGEVTLWDPRRRQSVGEALPAPAEVATVGRTRELRSRGGFAAPLTEERTGWVWFGTGDDGPFVEVRYADADVAVRYPIGSGTLIARACAVAGREPTAEEWARLHGDQPQRPTCPTAAPRSLLMH